MKGKAAKKRKRKGKGRTRKENGGKREEKERTPQVVRAVLHFLASSLQVVPPVPAHIAPSTVCTFSIFLCAHLPWGLCWFPFSLHKDPAGGARISSFPHTATSRWGDPIPAHIAPSAAQFLLFPSHKPTSGGCCGFSVVLTQGSLRWRAHFTIFLHGGLQVGPPFLHTLHLQLRSFSMFLPRTYPGSLFLVVPFSLHRIPQIVRAFLHFPSMSASRWRPRPCTHRAFNCAASPFTVNTPTSGGVAGFRLLHTRVLQVARAFHHLPSQQPSAGAPHSCAHCAFNAQFLHSLRTPTSGGSCWFFRFPWARILFSLRADPSSGARISLVSLRSRLQVAPPIPAHIAPSTAQFRHCPHTNLPRAADAGLSVCFTQGSLRWCAHFSISFRSSLHVVPPQSCHIVPSTAQFLHFQYTNLPRVAVAGLSVFLAQGSRRWCAHFSVSFCTSLQVLAPTPAHNAPSTAQILQRLCTHLPRVVVADCSVVLAEASLGWCAHFSIFLTQQPPGGASIPARIALSAVHFLLFPHTHLVPG